MKKKYFVHPSSIIDKKVSINQGTKIWHFCHVMSGAKIGKNCVLGQNVFIGSQVKIGNRVKIQNNVSVFQGVELKDNVFCGPSVTFTNVKSPRSEFPVNKKFAKTLVKKGAALGANSTVICGVTIGEYAFIGAGSVVTKDIPDYALVYGNPAQQHGFICQCGHRLASKGKNRFICAHCRKKYSFQNKTITLLE